MKLEELQKVFLVYKKDGVFRYISELENEYSKKLVEKDVKMSNIELEMKTRIQALEKENDDLRRELDELKGQQDNISMAILDARRSAEEMKERTRVQEEEARETIRKTLNDEMAELERYKNKLYELKKAIKGSLSGLEDQVEELESKVYEIESLSPGNDLTLFA